MAKPKYLVSAVVVVSGIIIVMIAAWLFSEYHPNSLEKRMHFAKRDAQKLVSENPVCYSNYDCKMIVLPTQECIPIDWVISYSKRTDPVEKIKKQADKYNDLYRRRYGKDQNRKCVKQNKPKAKCLRGKCVVTVYQGEVLKY